ncbi:IS1 family transposase [Aeromonas veronii]|uniref:IS1 family transposase n=1 Tax=Aeromonas veronii TaxID=654 RepID=UPI0038F32121
MKLQNDLGWIFQAGQGPPYAREVPSEMHLTGKIFTQRIERNNLTLRTRIKRLARKTICFSRSVELHEKVIGAFIERHHFN